LKWAGHVDRMGDENWQRCPESDEGKEVRNTEIAVEDCIKRHRKSDRRIVDTIRNDTVDTVRNGRKVRGRKKKMELNSP